MTGDNLGSLAIGGFKESCSALHCCRQCMATQETARSEVHKSVINKLIIKFVYMIYCDCNVVTIKLLI